MNIVDQRTGPRIREAIEGFQDLIIAHFPGTTFLVSTGNDPVGVYQDAVVDLDDPDEVMDLIIDRLLTVQIEERLPLYVIPMRTPERAAAVYARDYARPAPTETETDVLAASG